jgi:hypothetical protein
MSIVYMPCGHGLDDSGMWISSDGGVDIGRGEDIVMDGERINTDASDEAGDEGKGEAGKGGDEAREA